MRKVDCEILLLHYWDGQDANALGTVLRISIGAAATRLSRATERFRASYAQLSADDDKHVAARTRKG